MNSTLIMLKYSISLQRFIFFTCPHKKEFNADFSKEIPTKLVPAAGDQQRMLLNTEIKATESLCYYKCKTFRVTCYKR